MHSEGSLLSYTAQSTLVGAKVDASGQTELTGDYQTQAKLTFAGLDVGHGAGVVQHRRREGAVVDRRCR